MSTSRIVKQPTTKTARSKQKPPTNPGKKPSQTAIKKQKMSITPVKNDVVEKKLVPFLDRELSQIAFNWRVLAQAEDSTVP